MPLALLIVGRGRTRRVKGPGSDVPFPWFAPITPDLSPSLSKPKSKQPWSQPLSLPKSKPPYLNLSFSKPRWKQYPKNYNLYLKRKRNKRKPRGREREIGKWKMSLAPCLSFVFIDNVVFGWQENLRKIEKVTTSFFLNL